VGITYVGDSFASLSISGILNLWDSRVSSIVQVYEGPQKSITSATSTGPSTFLAGTADGRILDYNSSDHKLAFVKGAPHTNLVSAVSAAGGKAVSVGFDDKIKEIEGSNFV
jgi:WD40 repeat protein